VEYENKKDSKANISQIRSSAEALTCGCYSIFQIIMHSPEIQKLPGVIALARKDAENKEGRIFQKIKYDFLLRNIYEISKLGTEEQKKAIESLPLNQSLKVKINIKINNSLKEFGQYKPETKESFDSYLKEVDKIIKRFLEEPAISNAIQDLKDFTNPSHKRHSELDRVREYLEKQLANKFNKPSQINILMIFRSIINSQNHYYLLDQIKAQENSTIFSGYYKEFFRLEHFQYIAEQIKIDDLYRKHISANPPIFTDEEINICYDTFYKSDQYRKNLQDSVNKQDSLPLRKLLGSVITDPSKQSVKKNIETDGYELEIDSQAATPTSDFEEIFSGLGITTIYSQQIPSPQKNINQQYKIDQRNAILNNIARDNIKTSLNEEVLDKNKEAIAELRTKYNQELSNAKNLLWDNSDLILARFAENKWDNFKVEKVEKPNGIIVIKKQNGSSIDNQFQEIQKFLADRGIDATSHREDAKDEKGNYVLNERGARKQIITSISLTPSYNFKIENLGAETKKQDGKAKQDQKERFEQEKKVKKEEEEKKKQEEEAKKKTKILAEQKAQEEKEKKDKELLDKKLADEKKQKDEEEKKKQEEIEVKRQKEIEEQKRKDEEEKKAAAEKKAREEKEANLEAGKKDKDDKKKQFNELFSRIQSKEDLNDSEIAKEIRSSSIADYLAKNNPSTLPNLLIEAIFSGKIETANVILEKIKSLPNAVEILNSQDDYKETALSYAIGKIDPDNQKQYIEFAKIIKTLYDTQVDISLGDIDMDDNETRQGKIESIIKKLTELETKEIEEQKRREAERLEEEKKKAEQKALEEKEAKRKSEEDAKNKLAIPPTKSPKDPEATTLQFKTMMEKALRVISALSKADNEEAKKMKKENKEIINAYEKSIKFDENNISKTPNAENVRILEDPDKHTKIAYMGTGITFDIISVKIEKEPPDPENKEPEIKYTLETLKIAEPNIDRFYKSNANGDNMEEIKPPANSLNDYKFVTKIHYYDKDKNKRDVLDIDDYVKTHLTKNKDNKQKASEETWRKINEILKNGTDISFEAMNDKGEIITYGCERNFRTVFYDDKIYNPVTVQDLESLKGFEENLKMEFKESERKNSDTKRNSRV